MAGLLQIVYNLGYQESPSPQSLYGKTDDIYQLGQDTIDPPFFKLMPVFEGTWKGKSGISRQFGEFIHSEGWMRCQFAYTGIAKAKIFIVEIVDGVIFFTTRSTWTN